MIINKIDRQVLKMLNQAKIVRKVDVGHKENRYMKDACYRFSEITGRPLAEIQLLTANATLDQYTFLKTLMNKVIHQKNSSVNDRAEHILNIYSMVEKPSAQHLNIVRKSRDSFESLETIFALAKNKEALEYVENMQYGELKNSEYASKIIVDLLSSKNSDRFIANPERYSSFIELNADNENAVKILDNLIETGKFSKFRYDAQLAVKKLFKVRRIEHAMEGKTKDLEQMYTEERASFLKSIVNNFIPLSKAPEEETKTIIVNMYGTLKPSNAKLREAVIEKFKRFSPKDKSAEIVEMQSLFSKIDKNKDAEAFVEKVVNRDLKIDSIEELNEVLDTVELKKANIFFNNAKRIIEKTNREERKIALANELENPFYKAKEPKKARTIKMRNTYEYPESFLSKTAKFIENKINQFRYYHLAA